MRRTLTGVGLMALAMTILVHGVHAAEAERRSVHKLSEFGSLKTAAEADKTFQTALEQLTKRGGGVLMIPADAPENWFPRNTSQEVWRSPEPPAPAKRWGTGPGVTVIDARGGRLQVLAPQMSGLRLRRDMLLPQDQSSPHWDYHPILWVDNSIIRGSTSYLEWIQEPVKAGKDRRFYMNTVRGLFPGMFINIHAGPGYRGPVNRGYVQSIGYDTEKDMWYFVADVEIDVKKGAIAHNKTHTNLARMDMYSHTENQTFDFMIWRHEYSQGDTYMMDLQFNYMSDVHSTAGDENGVLYAAFVRSMTNPFFGQIDSYEAEKRALTYKGAMNANTLGTGRPIINLNETKWITGDDLIIVSPGGWWDLVPEHENPVFEGKTYPTRVIKSRVGTTELRMGGLMRFPADSAVTEDVVGRYIAVNEPGEEVPASKRWRGKHKVLRWYLIHDVKGNEDGTKTMRIVRHWWGAKPAGAPTLYKPEHYTRDGHVKPLSYIIAPGANLYDVSRGVRSGTRWASGAEERTIMVAPGPHQGTKFDFAAGDAVTQAVGPDPFRPVPWRCWLFENVPGAWPAPVFDVANHGPISRYALMTVGGGNGTLEGASGRYDRQPPWEHYILFNGAAGQGLVFNGDVADAAVRFNQPHGRPQTMRWRCDEGRKDATLSVAPDTGVMTIDSKGLETPSGLSRVAGLSGTQARAQNLRGIRVPVKAGSKTLRLTFPKAEPDAQYAVFVEVSWLTVKAVTEQTPEGFLIEFGTAPQTDAHLHWLLVR